MAGSLGVGTWLALAHPEQNVHAKLTRTQKLAWRMPPLATLAPARLSKLDRGWLLILRVYLVAAVLMVVYKVTLLALQQG